MLSADGQQIVNNTGATEFNKAFSACPVVQYVKEDAIHSVYVRTSVIPDDFNAFKVTTHLIG